MDKFLSFLAGCGAGIVAGMVLAPSSGQELRNNLSHKVQQGIDEGRRVVREQGGIRGVVEKGVERGRNVANIAMHRVSETAQKGSNRFNETVQSAKNRLNESIQAGETEYREQLDRDASGL
jgi:gas vesicle protein